MQREPIGVGIIGTGFGAKVQLPGFSDLENVRVIGNIAGRTPEEWQPFIQSPEIQVISIATPPFTHEELVKAALDAGKHVLCEKPFTLNTRQAYGLLKKAKTSGLVHGIDFEFRELPALQLLKTELQSGTIGALTRAEFRWETGTWANAQNPWRWQCDKASGGGILGALGVHLFDSAQWLCGRAMRLKGMASTRIMERPDDTGGRKPVTSEDTADMELHTESALPIHVHVTNVDPAGKGLTITLEGTQGTLALTSVTPAYGTGLHVRRNDEVLLAEEPAPAGTDARIPPFRAFAQRFLHAVREGDTTFSPSFEDGAYTQAVRCAALASNGSWIDIAGLEQ